MRGRENLVTKEWEEEKDLGHNKCRLEFKGTQIRQEYNAKEQKHYKKSNGIYSNVIYSIGERRPKKRIGGS